MCKCVRFFSKQTSQNRISLSALQAIESRRTLTWLLQQSARVGKKNKKVHWHMAHKKKFSNQSYYFSFGSTCHSSHRGAQKVLMPGSQHETNRQKAAAAWQFARNENAEGKTGGGKTFASTLNLIVLRQEGQSGFCGWLGLSIVWYVIFLKLFDKSRSEQIKKIHTFYANYLI